MNLRFLIGPTMIGACVFGGSCLGGQDGVEAKGKQFRAGAATSNITPAIGGLIIGGFHPLPSTHIHDELHARCLVLDNGETRMALVIYFNEAIQFTNSSSDKGLDSTRNLALAPVA
jgi:hypothetical protein